ncbi:hypothetical protein KUV85_02065 [Nocardioides panacisoli]|uniref:hypothetical protein n=1 Tax=Nocardioides panacisoli TaxID=627624 RepID=UPI001C62B576|nr:hypothetical protein [Nocardioides panacisoli]QYJ04488.1 hypothetical protein KUV85_02065 [Nocardioides panacisoli]
MNHTITNWGPAKHDPDHPLHHSSASSLQVAVDRRDHRVGTDQRDEEIARPDDN